MQIYCIGSGFDVMNREAVFGTLDKDVVSHIKSEVVRTIHMGLRVEPFKSPSYDSQWFSAIGMCERRNTLQTRQAS